MTTVSDQVWTQIWNKVRQCTSAPIRNRVRNMIMVSVEHQMWRQVSHPVKRQVEEDLK